MLALTGSRGSAPTLERCRGELAEEFEVPLSEAAAVLDADVYRDLHHRPLVVRREESPSRFVQLLIPKVRHRRHTERIDERIAKASFRYKGNTAEIGRRRPSARVVDELEAGSDDAAALPDAPTLRSVATNLLGQLRSESVLHVSQQRRKIFVIECC